MTGWRFEVMKQSHRKVLNLLHSGCWFRTNEYSLKTILIYRDLKYVRSVRTATVEEMKRIGLLRLGIRNGVTAYIPNELPHEKDI